MKPHIHILELLDFTDVETGLSAEKHVPPKKRRKSVHSLKCYEWTYEEEKEAEKMHKLLRKKTTK